MNINCAVDKSKYKKDRVILHSDCNGFYASVECLHHPEIRNKPVAVSGDAENRHGIILAKNEIASCKISLADRIVIDEFKNHKTMGEFILIDRVTNMTSACGVVRKTFASQDRSQIGKVDEQVRAGLKGQTPVVVEFPIGKEGITLDFAEQVEKGLTVLGKHTYLYHPAASENYAETVRHLKAAGLIVLLVLDENTAKDETLKTLDGFYANWQIDGITVKDAIDFVKKKSAFTVQSVHDGNYI